MTLRPGDQLASTVSAAKVVVVRVPAGADPALACGGSPMVPAAAAGDPSGAATDGGETLPGKRYVDEAGTFEVLCTAAGAGQLTADGAAMTLKSAKPLPASD